MPVQVAKELLDQDVTQDRNSERIREQIVDLPVDNCCATGREGVP